MGNYIDHRISGNVSQQFRRVVTGKTDIVSMMNGRERRNAAWAFKKMQYTATFNALTRAAQLEIVSAFYAANAQLLLFRFRDYGDYVVTDSPLATDSLVGTTTAVQLTKRYTFGAATADRQIQAIVTSTVSDSGGHAVDGTVDTALGLFTPAAAWGEGAYTWSGQFDVWVRFNSDELDVTMNSLELTTSDVTLMEALATAS